MKIGKVLFFDPYKGFGRIKSQEDDSEVFVHVNGLIEQVYKDNIVTYQVKKINDVEQAYAVRRIN